MNVRYNVMKIQNLEAFGNIVGRYNGEQKDVYFVRALNYGQADETISRYLDSQFAKGMDARKGVYRHINKLPLLTNREEIERYEQSYSEWIACGKASLLTDSITGNEELKKIFGQACKRCLVAYETCRGAVSDSIKKNFVIKLMHYFEKTVCDLFGDWNEQKLIKIVCENVTKQQDYFFYYLLTLMGCDVMVLQGSEDIPEELEELALSDSFIIKQEDISRMAWQARQPQVTEAHSTQPIPQPAATPVIPASTRPVVTIPPNPSHTRPAAVAPPAYPAERRELSYEELANLASSVVMIAVLDEKDKSLGTGSGIMIARDGYILTNAHVVCGGRKFAVRIEDEEQTYITDEIIKYNQVQDLALLRIDRILNPIPVYNGNQSLARGQKVVAIGSPLGLFNSVSDGIVSGFRDFDGVQMIQYTAPTSHGSSGGAVLNLYGELIGISTAGYDGGQNLSLAMGYETIQPFVRGFVK